MSEAKTHKVTMDGFEFNPKDVTIEVGDSVEWSNGADEDWHSATGDGEAPLFDSPKIFAGDDPFTFTFDKAGGPHAYHCRNHHHMTGSVTVTKPAAGPTGS